MNEDKIIEVKEEKVSIVTSVTPNSTEVEEKVEDVVVQVATPLSLEIEDENLIDVEIEEAFPYIVSGVLDKTLGDKDVLIDAGIANVANNDETVGLQEVIEAAAAQGGSGGTVDHSLLNGREFEDQHPITAISGLRDELDDIEAVKRVYSSENGLSEFRKWDDGNPEMENRAGYFVKLVQGTDNIAICTDEDDVYGIAVTHSGFVGNQIQADKSDDPSYSMVGIAGALRVRTDGTARNGEYVVPNELGIATFSTNNCGYKVISQGSYSSYQYVTIAVTPQNDKLSKVYGMLTDTSSGGTIGNLIIQIEDIESQIKENNQKVDIIVSDNESIKDILEENQSNIKEVTDISNKALEDAQAAKDSVASAIESANEATQKAQDAALEAQNAANDLADVSQLADEMEVLISYEHNGETGIAGLVAATNENTMNLGAVMETVDEQGDSIASLLLRKDDDGVAIQSLVSHIDRYSVGKYSTSYGLTKQNAQSILTNAYIYVPTQETSTEIMYDVSINEETGKEIRVENSTTFARGYSYTWDHTTATWKQSEKQVSFATTYQDGTDEGDLWLCWGNDVDQLDENGDLVHRYLSGTLYRWFGTSWIAVASVADNEQSRMLTSVTQTADDITQSVTNAVGEGSTFKQGLDSIFATVNNNDGYLSSIEQTAEMIRLGTYTDDGKASQLESLMSDTDATLNAVVSGRFHVMYQSYIGTSPEVYEGGNKYSKMPLWSDAQGGFVFNEEYADNTNGIYYFHNDDKTKYCKIVDGGYEIYTIGNKATAGMNSRITQTEAVLMGTAQFDTEETTSLGDIYIHADKDGTSVTSVAAHYYHTLKSIESEAPEVYGTYKYVAPPVWNWKEGKYVFDIADRGSEDTPGTYYLIDADAQTYCSVVTTGGEEPQTLYEIYTLGANSTAAIIQDVTANKTTVGMIAENGEVKGSLLIDAINNDKSEATLNADKVNISGFVTFDNLSTVNTKTTINGGNITTGVIKSEDYKYTSGNYSTDGTCFDLSNGVIRSTNFAIDGSGNAYFKGHIEAKSGTIGGFTIGDTALYNGKSTLDSTDTGVYLGTNGISIGSKSITLKSFDDDGKTTISTTIAPGFKVTSDGDVSCANLGFGNGAIITNGEFFIKDDETAIKNGISMPFIQTQGIQITGLNGSESDLGVIYRHGTRLTIKNINGQYIHLIANSGDTTNRITFCADSDTSSSWYTAGSDLNITTQGIGTYELPDLYLSAAGMVYLQGLVEFDEGAWITFGKDTTINFANATVQNLHATFA